MKRQSRWDYEKYIDRKGLQECWPWISATTTDGYPRFGAEGTQWYVTRLVYQKRHGEVLDWTGRLIMHLCNNPRCCNPDHLYLGTPKENMEHAGSCGMLSRKWVQNGNSKLNQEQVAAIRLDTRPSRAVAKAFGIEKTQVLRIRKGVHWNGSS